MFTLLAIATAVKSICFALLQLVRDKFHGGACCFTSRRKWGLFSVARLYRKHLTVIY